MKKFHRVLLMVLVATLLFTTAYASDISVYLDGKQLQFDQPPIIDNDRTLVPLRGVFQALGAYVEYDPATARIVASKDDTVVKLTVGDPDATINDRTTVLAVPPKVVNNRTLVPLRFVSEALGALVNWDGNTSTITIISPVPQAVAPLRVHYIDVGQADSILIDLPSGSHMLIDGGNNVDGSLIVNYLKQQGVTRLAYIVATHPHEDHIGGLDTVIKAFDIGKVYAPNAVSTTATFEDFLAAVEQKGLKLNEAKTGVTLDLGNGVTGIFVGPTRTDYDDLNNTSAVFRLVYGDTSFLFAGDAEKLAENDVLATGQDISADVLKVGHHGSDSSTGSIFLRTVNPKYAVISVGKDNDYGHPASTTLDTLTAAGVQVYRTDEQGTIVATSDAKTVTFDKSASPIKERAPDVTSGVVIDSIDLSREIVSIRNTGSTAVDLSGWKVVSEVGGQSYTFPVGTKLSAGAVLKIVSGPSAQASTDTLVWSRAYIWNNDGDPGALHDAQGQLVSRK